MILTNLNKNLILPKYFYYFLFSIQTKIYSLSSGGGSPTISYKDLYNLDIYFPSLPYQQQIVKILDEFTELEAELEARKIQYKFWQQYLLNDKN
ncbi:restriction endonuclease subunit S [bacterium]|nr:restriction endonuclease subunit S [bacterium]